MNRTENQRKERNMPRKQTGGQRAAPAELPGVKGPGVEPLVIPALDKFIEKYEKHKAARCAESPGEIAAKKELKLALQQQKNNLPKNAEGKPFYRSQDYERDYIIDEKMVVKKVMAEDGGDE